jgi:GT2 family glycosyltransferase
MDLSIIIPTYNRNSQLAECLQSLEHNDAEIIVVDDGSPKPVEVPHNVRLIRHERNRGRAAALNTGLRVAVHDLVLTIDDDIYAAPDMVSRLADEFAVWNNPKLAIVGRVVWDPEVKMTLTMRWLEEFGPFRDISKKRSGVLSNLATGNTMMWRPFVLQNGGFDEEFSHPGLADVELGLRLKQSGLEVRLLASAMGFHHRTMRVRDLVERELREGMSAVYLHSKFPEYLPQINDNKSLMQNAPAEKDALCAVEEIALLEQSDSNRLQFGIPDLFMVIHRYYFLVGILNGLNSRETARLSNGSAATLGLFNQASLLISAGEAGEARRLFRLVRSRQDSEYWAESEYQLGAIETETGNEQTARLHFMNCLSLEPYHRRALEKLKQPSIYHEVEPNVFERVDPRPVIRILFVVFGELDEVLNAFPVVQGLREKFHGSNIVWLTAPAYASLARASGVDEVIEFEPRGAVPWDWVSLQGFTHVFQPEVVANSEEWEAAGLHPMDFMAKKCGVPLKSRRARLDPGTAARMEALSFLKESGLTSNSFLAVSYNGETRKTWPVHNLHKLATAVGMPVVILGRADESPIAGTISFNGRAHRTMAALIGLSAFFLGPDFGVSWLAATTDTPMGVFVSSGKGRRLRASLADIIGKERDDLTEWAINVSDDAVVHHISSTIEILSRIGGVGGGGIAASWL